MKRFLSVPLIFLLISLSDAQFYLEKYNPPDRLTTGVKSILRENTSLDDCGMCYPLLTIFKYDNRNRIEKTIQYYGVDFKDTNLFTIYTYDTNGRLTNKSVYMPKNLVHDSTILFSSTEYGYLNGLLVSVKTKFHSKNSNEEVKYKYEDGRLCSLMVYNSGKLSYNSIFEYENKRIIREIPLEEKGISNFKYHFFYNNDTLSEIRFCNDDGVRRNWAHYSYNQNGKISTVKVSRGGGFGLGPTYNEKYEY